MERTPKYESRLATAEQLQQADERVRAAVAALLAGDFSQEYNLEGIFSTTNALNTYMRYFNEHHDEILAGVPGYDANTQVRVMLGTQPPFPIYPTVLQR